jgi:hypothetical protein
MDTVDTLLLLLDEVEKQKQKQRAMLISAE